MTLTERLEQIHDSQEALEDGGAILYSKKRHYVSGVPYNFSYYQERAFRFKSVEQAKQVAIEFELDDFEPVSMR